MAVPLASAEAAALRHGKVVTVGPGDVINDDLYAAGSDIDIQGTVRGDVVAAGRAITVSGVVTGNLISASRTATVTGRVEGTIRSAGETVTITGAVGRDLVAAGREVEVAPNARIGRDILAGANSVKIGGRVGRNVRMDANTATIGGPIGGGVQARVHELSLTDGAVVERDLVYISEEDVSRAPGATVRGKVERKIPERERPGGAARVGMGVVGWVRGVVGLFAFGLLVLLLLPDFAGRALGALKGSPGPSVGLGLAVFAATPFLALMVFIVGLLIGGWWIGLGAVAAYLLALPLAYAVTGTFVGSWILERAGRPKTHRAWALLTGLAVLTLVGLIPLLGGLVCLLAILFGLGALTLAVTRAGKTAGAGRTA